MRCGARPVRYLALALGLSAGCSSGSPSAGVGPTRTLPAVFTGAWQGEAVVADCYNGGVCNATARRGSRISVLFRLNESGDGRVDGVIDTYVARFDVVGTRRGDELDVTAIRSISQATLSDCVLNVSGGTLTGRFTVTTPSGIDGRWSGGTFRAELDRLTRAETIVPGAAPTFSGTWSGYQTATSCANKGWDPYGCWNVPNATNAFKVILSQSGDAVTGTWMRNGFNDPVAVSGSVANGVLTLTGSSGGPISGGTGRWTLVSTSFTVDAVGRLSGTFVVNYFVAFDNNDPELPYRDARTENALQAVIRVP